MRDRFLIRRATPADVEVITRHRTHMFLDMGSVAPDLIDELATATRAFLGPAIERGEYVGWLASAEAEPQSVVAGAGVQTRRVLPFPRRWPDGRAEVALGRQAIVLNVYTEKAFRRLGLARRLMHEVLAWARSEHLDSLVLHAAPDGRPLYESLDFKPTNEMRFMGDLVH